jgi:hypothetical protein
VAEVVRTQLPAPVTAALQRLRTDDADAYAALAEAAETIDPTLQGALDLQPDGAVVWDDPSCEG